MSALKQNLWPEDIAVTDALAPVTILRGQASLLGQRTSNLVEGRVVLLNRLNPDYQFCYSFYLVAPVLGDYRYNLFSILHGMEFYPVRIEFDVAEYPRNAENEDEFMNELKNVFASEKTKAIIGSLIAQSKA